MNEVLFKPITAKEFLEWIPENSNKRYELHNGAIVEMSQPTGEHEDVTGFLTIEISSEIKRLKLPYSVPKTALIQSASSESAYSPDILILNKLALKLEELWAKYSTVQRGTSIPLVIEVVSSNWRDDYYKKLGEYVGRSPSRRVEIKIPEYWIVDYLGLGGIKYIGNPKQPTLSIYNLVNDEYQINQFRGNDRIISTAFPELQLTAQQIFNGAL
jgi:Uma2 family endonuclease